MKWGYAADGRKRLFADDEPLPPGFADTPAAHWSEAERAAPNWPAWYVEAMRRAEGSLDVTGVAETATAEAPRKRGRPRKVVQ